MEVFQSSGKDVKYYQSLNEYHIDLMHMAQSHLDLLQHLTTTGKIFRGVNFHW